MSIGKKNRYSCIACKNKTITIDVDEGVTPFMIECFTDGCDKFATSAMYMCPQDLPATHEWYAPDRKERRRLRGGEKEHVEQGGLLLRPITKRGKWRMKTGPLK